MEHAPLSEKRVWKTKKGSKKKIASFLAMTTRLSLFIITVNSLFLSRIKKSLPKNIERDYIIII
jgi:hypothetical protein